MKEFGKIFQMITGMTVSEVIDDKLSGVSDAEIMRKIDTNIRREHEKSDVFRNAYEELNGPTKEGDKEQ